MNGVGNMEYTNGILNKTVYNKILKKNVKQNAEKLGMLHHLYLRKIMIANIQQKT